MKSSSAGRLAITVAVAVCSGMAAQAEEYRVVASDSGTICQSGTKTDPVTIEGRDDVKIAGRMATP